MFRLKNVERAVPWKKLQLLVILVTTLRKKVGNNIRPAPKFGVKWKEGRDRFKIRTGHFCLNLTQIKVKTC